MTLKPWISGTIPMEAAEQSPGVFINSRVILQSSGTVVLYKFLHSNFFCLLTTLKFRAFESVAFYF